MEPKDANHAKTAATGRDPHGGVSLGAGVFPDRLHLAPGGVALANYVTGTQAFAWRLYSIDGQPAMSSARRAVGVC